MNLNKWVQLCLEGSPKCGPNTSYIELMHQTWSLIIICKPKIQIFLVAHADVSEYSDKSETDLLPSAF